VLVHVPLWTQKQGKRLWVRAPCKNDPESGLSRAAQSRRGVTAPEQRQQGTGGRHAGCRGGYGLWKLAQQDQEEHVVLTEA
jgi:hypothetical protein